MDGDGAMKSAHDLPSQGHGGRKRASVKLTAGLVNRLDLPEGKVDYTFFDDAVKGFGVRVRAGEEIGEAWVPFDQIPLPFGEVTTDPQQESRISHGQTVLVRELAAEEGDWIKLVNRRREMIAIGTVVERIGSGGVGLVQPKVVFR